MYGNMARSAALAILGIASASASDVHRDSPASQATIGANMPSASWTATSRVGNINIPRRARPCDLSFCSTRLTSTATLRRPIGPKNRGLASVRCSQKCSSNRCKSAALSRVSSAFARNAKGAAMLFDINPSTPAKCSYSVERLTPPEPPQRPPECHRVVALPIADRETLPAVRGEFAVHADPVFLQSRGTGHFLCFRTKADVCPKSLPSASLWYAP